MLYNFLCESWWEGAILYNSGTEIKRVVILSVKHFELLGVYDKLHSYKLEE